MKPVLIKKLLQSLGQDPNSEEKLKDAFFAFKVRNEEEEDESNSNFGTWGQEDVETGGGEVFDKGNKPWNSLGPPPPTTVHFFLNKS